VVCVVLAVGSSSAAVTAPPRPRTKGDMTELQSLYPANNGICCRVRHIVCTKFVSTETYNSIKPPELVAEDTAANLTSPWRLVQHKSKHFDIIEILHVTYIISKQYSIKPPWFKSSPDATTAFEVVSRFGVPIFSK
jgi:hypothetical protein